MFSEDYFLCIHSSNASLDWTGWRNLRRLVDPLIPEHPPNIRLHCRASEGEVKFVRVPTSPDYFIAIYDAFDGSKLATGLHLNPNDGRY